MTTVHNWMQNPAWVNGGYGGVSSIATTTFQNAGLPILKNQCAMLQQASFYEAQWPAGTKVGPNGDIMAFKLPAVNPQIPTPVEGGGEFMTAFSSDPATQAVQNYLSSPQWADSRIKVAPGWVSANQKVDQSPLHRPDRPAVGEVPGRPDRDLRVRRLRLDAGRGRLGPGVEVDGRLVQQPEHAGRHHRLADRRGLAKQLI